MSRVGANWLKTWRRSTGDKAITGETLYNRAIEIRERLVNVEGRRELAGDLAWVKALRGVALIKLGDTERGKRDAHHAMAVLRTEVKRTNRVDLKAILDFVAKQLGEQPG